MTSSPERAAIRGETVVGEERMFPTGGGARRPAAIHLSVRSREASQLAFADDSLMPP
jgi:hypothetical protein